MPKTYTLSDSSLHVLNPTLNTMRKYNAYFLHPGSKRLNGKRVSSVQSQEELLLRLFNPETHVFFRLAACLIFSPLSLQFLHRAQMQTPRPTLPTNTPSLRPGSQTPTAAAVYPPNQTIMMTMAPMPFPSAQTAQYYIPQVPKLCPL